MDTDHEEVEQIPWAMLAEDLQGRRPKWLAQGVLAVVAALIVGFVAMRVLRAPSGTVVDLTPAPVSASIVAAAPGVDTTAVVDNSDAEPQPAAAFPAPALYSEADLMAVLPQDRSLLAEAHAEWFIVDFFGATGDGAIPGLPDGLPAPEVGDGYSWVEWARAIATTQTARGFDVTVAFRTLTGSEDAGYRRLPVRAVVVPVAVDPAGATAIADLPTPVVLPVGVATPVAGGEDEPPSDIATEALDRATTFGEEAMVVGGSATTSGWRVVISVRDESGVQWPLVVHVED